MDACVHLCDFVVGGEVVDSDEAVRVAACCHGVFWVEAGDHELCGFGDGCFHEDLVLERDLLDDPWWSDRYL